MKKALILAVLLVAGAWKSEAITIRIGHASAGAGLLHAHGFFIGYDGLESTTTIFESQPGNAHIGQTVVIDSSNTAFAAFVEEATNGIRQTIGGGFQELGLFHSVPDFHGFRIDRFEITFLVTNDGASSGGFVFDTYGEHVPDAGATAALLGLGLAGLALVRRKMLA